MKLLICTQVVDKDHPILGFFHRWIEEFAKHCEVVHVICLYEGEHSLPTNVHVHSLGKEGGESRIKYLTRFYSYIWKLRNEYDTVFVHMNQIYVILGGLVWRTLHKRIGLWYTHGSVSISLKIAEKLTDQVLTASADSFKLSSKKIIVTGHGVDTEHFTPTNVPKDLDLITVGRISRSKNLNTLIDIFAQIRSGSDVSLTILGEAITDADREYKTELERKIHDLQFSHFVKLVGPVSQTELPMYLNRAKAFVTVAQNGSLDKTVLEAMSCNLPVISMAPGTISLPLNADQVETDIDFINAVKLALNSDETSDNYRVYIQKNHGLDSLIFKMKEILSN